MGGRLTRSREEREGEDWHAGGGRGKSHSEGTENAEQTHFFAKNLRPSETFDSHPVGCLTLRAMLRIVSPKLRFGGAVQVPPRSVPNTLQFAICTLQSAIIPPLRASAPLW